MLGSDQTEQYTATVTISAGTPTNFILNALQVYAKDTNTTPSEQEATVSEPFFTTLRTRW